MAGQALKPSTPRSDMNWVAVLAMVVLAASVLFAGAAAYRENWYAMAGAGVFALAGVGLALLSKVE